MKSTKQQHQHHQQPLFSRVLVALLVTARGALCGEELRITNAEELVAFSRNVNAGTSYAGATVFLDNDIDFAGVEGEGLSQQFDVIGKDPTNCFRGTFNGQRDAVRGLAVNSSDAYAGLFGISTGAIIRNLVVDGTCSVTSSYTNPMLGAVGGKQLHRGVQGCGGCCPCAEERDIRDGVRCAPRGGVRCLRAHVLLVHLR